MTAFSESSRKLVHMGVGLCALLLPWLSWQQAAICAAAALAVNLFVLPRLAGHWLFRPDELAGRRPAGIAIYPASVLALIVVFRSRIDLTAIAWVVLAVGDGVATLVGRRLGARAPRWPWNPDKRIAASAAFLVCAAAAGIAVAQWTAPAVPVAVPSWFPWVAPPAAALLAMLAETMPVGLDDNVSVPAAAAGVLWGLTLIDGSLAVDALSAAWTRAPAAVAVNGIVALAGWRAGAVSGSGVAGGLAVGLVIWLAAGPAAWSLLLAGFIVAAATSRLGLSRKRLLGIAEQAGGRRGAANAFANCGLGAAAACVGMMSPHAAAASLAMAAALVSGASDTAASEVGKAWGRTTWSPLTRSRVPPGTAGGMSAAGTLGGAAAAAGLAALAASLGIVPASAAWTIAAASIVAMTAEGAIAAALEPGGLVNNDLLNFLQTAIAAALAVALDRAGA